MHTARSHLATSEVPSPYEQLLRADRGVAMSESSRFFEGSSKLHESLRALAKQFEDLNIPYAVVGGMALTVHGFARMTDHIDVLVTRVDLRRLHEAVVGRGYRRVFEGSKSLRDTRTGVKSSSSSLATIQAAASHNRSRFRTPAKPITSCMKACASSGFLGSSSSSSHRA